MPSSTRRRCSSSTNPTRRSSPITRHHITTGTCPSPEGGDTMRSFCPHPAAGDGLRRRRRAAGVAAGAGADQAALRARRRRQRAADAVRRRGRQAGQGAHQRPHRDPGVPELAAGRRRRAGRRRQVRRHLDGPPRLRVARQDRVDDRGVQHAVRLPRRRAQPARDRRAHLARAAARSTSSWSRRATCASSAASSRARAS